MSSTTLTERITGISKILAAAVAVLLVGALLLAVTGNDGKKYVTVDFPQVNSVYEGSDVKILGVTVGRVETLTPRGEVVRARLSYEGDVDLPQDVKAVVVSPAIVGDRFIQFAPAFSGGTPLADNAFLPVDRTAVPVELDTIYKSLDDLSVALGPKGANSDGALSRLLDDTAVQLDGQGEQLNETIANFGKLSTTLADNKDELFGTVREVSDFVSLLKSNDDAVRGFNESTARVSTVLEGERQDLRAALRQLSLALVDVNELVTDNQSELRDNVQNLRTLSGVLADNTDELEEATVTAPTALANVALAYNQGSGTLDTRASLDELLQVLLADPVGLVCGILDQPVLDGTCAALSDLVDNVGVSALLEQVLGLLSSGAGTPELPSLDPGALPLDLPRVAAASAPAQPQSAIEQMLAVQ